MKGATDAPSPAIWRRSARRSGRPTAGRPAPQRRSGDGGDRPRSTTLRPARSSVAFSCAFRRAAFAASAATASRCPIRVAAGTARLPAAASFKLCVHRLSSLLVVAAIQPRQAAGGRASDRLVGLTKRSEETGRLPDRLRVDAALAKRNRRYRRRFRSVLSSWRYLHYKFDMSIDSIGGYSTRFVKFSVGRGSSLERRRTLRCRMGRCGRVALSCSL